MSLSTLIQEFRAFYARNPGLNEIGDSGLEGCVREALREFSRFSPRRNQRAQISISAGDGVAALPANFTSASLVELWNLYQVGQSLPSRFHRTRLSVFGPTEWVLGTDEVQLTTADDGKPALWLRESAASSRSATLRYDALHEIDADTDTVPEGLRGALLDFVLAQAMTLRARAVPREAQANKGVVSVDYSALAAEARHRAQSALQPLGARG